MKYLISIAIILSLFGCGDADYISKKIKEREKREQRAETERNHSGFKEFVMNRYNEFGEPKIINLNSYGPDTFNQDTFCYRVSAIVEYYPSAESKVKSKMNFQMFCKSGYCWEEKLVKIQTQE